MTVQRQVGKDEPVMIAWTAYQQTENFANTKRWATHVDHVQGSLWAAFSTGFYAGGKAAIPSPTPPTDDSAVQRVVEALGDLRVRAGIIAYLDEVAAYDIAPDPLLKLRAALDALTDGAGS